MDKVGNVVDRTPQKAWVVILKRHECTYSTPEAIACFLFEPSKLRCGAHRLL